MDSAKDLCRIINQSVENDDLLKGKKSLTLFESDIIRRWIRFLSFRRPDRKLRLRSQHYARQ